jgi:uncharacterized protein (DUF2147 family)
MRYLVMAAALLVALPAQAFADDAVGVWLTEGGKSRVEIAPCAEDKYCGTIVWLKDPNNEDGTPKLDVNNQDEALRDRPIVGLDLVKGFTEEEEGKYRGGQIYNPEDGKTYSAKMTVQDPDTLEVEGCVLFFCKGTVWTRVDKDTASN